MGVAQTRLFLLKNVSCKNKPTDGWTEKQKYRETDQMTRKQHMKTDITDIQTKNLSLKKKDAVCHLTTNLRSLPFKEFAMYFFYAGVKKKKQKKKRPWKNKRKKEQKNKLLRIGWTRV